MKKKQNTSSNNWDVEYISLGSQIKTPTFNIDENKKVVDFGEDNDIPRKLTKYYTSVPMHSAIINRKTNLIIDGGLVDENGDPLTDNPNPFENWNILINKISNDIALYNECYLKIGWERGGDKPKEYYHIIHDKVRLSKPNENGIVEVGYVNEKYNVDMYEWATYNDIPSTYIKAYPMFGASRKKEVQILHIKAYNTVTVYGLPDYFSALKDLDTLAEISTFHNANIHNNMQPGFKFIFAGNEPPDDVKDKYFKSIKDKYSSASNTGKPLVFFVPEGANMTAEPIAVSDVSKMYNILSKDVKENILVSHQIPRKIAGIETAGSLGSSKEILEQLDLFKTTVIAPMQRTILNYLEPLLGMELKFNKTPNDLLLMFSISELTNVLTQNEIRELMGKEEIEVDLAVEKTELSLFKRLFK